MQPKLSLIKNARAWSVALLLITGLALVLNASAAGKNFKLGLQLADGSYCATQKGSYKYTGTSDIATSGLIPSLWATDTNGYDPDCMNLELQPAASELKSDFRVCLQFADSVVLNRDGSIRTLSQVGTMQCTPWASDGGGWSKAATDSNGYDWDAAQVAIETRALPAGKIAVSDYRIGGRLCDRACTTQFGTTQYTPWASAGGGKSAWFSDSNWYDSDGGQLVLEVTEAIAGCTEPVPANEQPTVVQGTNAVMGIDGTGTGWKNCSSDSLLTNLRLHNATDDRKEWSGTCTDTERMVDTNFSYTAANGTLLAAGDPRPVYPSGDDAYCATDEALVGALYYDDDASGNRDEGIRAISCRKLAAGASLDLQSIQVFPNAGCGANECNSYSSTYGSLNNAKDSQGRPFVPIGMNIRPNDSHKYARGIWAAPLKAIPPRVVECPREVPPPTPNPNPNPNPTPNPNPNPNPGAGGGNNGGSNPPAATCTLTANPATIVLNIGSSRLDWNCSATGPVTISAVDNTGFAPVENQPAQGSMQVAPDKTTTFKVTSSNASATATVTVGGSVFDETGGL